MVSGGQVETRAGSSISDEGMRDSLNVSPLETSRKASMMEAPEVSSNVATGQKQTQQSTSTATGAAAGADGGLLDTYWQRSVEDVLRALGSSAGGLSTAEAQVRLHRTPDITAHHRHPGLVILLRQFLSPVTLILIFATIAAAALGDLVESSIIFAIVLLSGFLSFWQERAASRAVDDLLASVQVSVEVERGGQRLSVPANTVVHGDIVCLDTGDLIPGDCRIIDADELLADESTLTGESFPVEKTPGILSAQTPLADRSNCLFMGAHIVRGTATAVVVKTGSETEFGHIAAQLEHQAPKTRFEQGIAEFGRLLLRVMVVIVFLIFASNIVLSRPLFESLLFSVALAVGLTPQLLPAIVSVSLSLGAQRMARAKVIVKRLSAIEDFGGMDVLCTDKTGTLTEGAVRMQGALGVDGSPNTAVREAAYLNAFHHTGYANPIDEAILTAGHVDTAGTERCGEVPYDFQRKCLSVLVAKDGIADLLTKGAVEAVLAASVTATAPDGRIVPLTESEPTIRATFAALSGQGYRVLGVARKEIPMQAFVSPDDEVGMNFLGFVAFVDPPKIGVDATLRDLAAMGISLRMVTGDNRFVAAHVAGAVGIDARRVLTGDDMRDLSDEELARQVDGVHVFAEVDPVQKERVISALRGAGHDVGYLGDGINDAPALHAADVSISVDTAVPVAKDAASIVLLEKDLAVLMEGVRLGRQTFANTLKYIFVTTSANFGNMASMAVATLFLPFLPLLPLQILLINFLTDLPGMTIAADTVDPEQVQRPGVWDITFIRRFMLLFGLISSGFDLLTFGVLRLVLGSGAEMFRSGWFLESVATELAVMLVLRTRRPFFRSRPGHVLLTTSIVVALLSLALPFSPLAGVFGFVSLPASLLLALAAITAGYIAATEWAKARFYARAAVTDQIPARPITPTSGLSTA